MEAAESGSRSPEQQDFNWRRATTVGAVMGTLILAGVLYTAHKERSKQAVPAAPSPVQVEVRTSPPGATVRVDNEPVCTSNCRLALTPGIHQVQVSLAGYEAAVTTLNVTADVPDAVDLALNPLPPGLRVYTDFGSGKVFLDEVPAGDLQEGQWVLDRLMPGKHSLRIAGFAGEARLSFVVESAALPVVEGPVQARGLLALVAANFGSNARIYANVPQIKVVIDGVELGQIPGEGLGVQNLAEGDRALLAGEGAQQRKVLLNVGNRPLLTVFLKLDLDAGTLVVATGEDEVGVFLNDKEYRRKTQRGQLRIPLLPVGSYTVRVAKEGFQMELPQQAEIRKGEETKLEFRLRPQPKVASLRIRGAVPGAAVMLDESPAGVVQGDGTFSAVGISPGDRNIELRLQGYAPRRLSRQFRAGETTELVESDVAMERATGTVRILSLPAGGRVTIRRADGQEVGAAGPAMALAEGVYTLTAAAPGFLEKSVTVQIAAGETKSIDFALERPKPPPPKEARYGTMQDWEQPAAWVLDGAWYVRKGGNFVFYRTTPAAGVFTFTTALFRGKRIQWFFGWMDPKNYVLYQLERKNFVRREVVQGRARESKVEHGFDRQESYDLRIEVSGDSIVHQIRDGQQWKILDRFQSPGRDLASGRFGMYIPGGDEFGLSNFRFQPK